MTKKRIWGIAGGVVGLVVVAAMASRHYRARMELRDVLPTFTEPGAGPRAPTAEAFGLRVGSSTLDEVTAWVRQAGLDCADTSMRALMAKARDAKRAEIAAAKARGQSLDAVTGASMVKRRSPKEANPQVRMSCENVPASLLAAFEEKEGPVTDGQRDRQPAPGNGRLLMVFDSPKHPLRHVSFERSFVSATADMALDEYKQIRGRLAGRFGSPSQTSSKEATGPARLKWLSPEQTAWAFSDLRVVVTALHYGSRGIVIGQTVEVPWPIRADAPARLLADKLLSAKGTVSLGGQRLP